MLCCCWNFASTVFIGFSCKSIDFIALADTELQVAEFNWLLGLFSSSFFPVLDEKYQCLGFILVNISHDFYLWFETMFLFGFVASILNATCCALSNDCWRYSLVAAC